MSSGTDALMGLLMDSSLKSNDNKAKINVLIQNDKGEELTSFLSTLKKSEKVKLLSNSIIKFGENVPLRQAIHHRSFSCIRSLILAGAEVNLADGAKAILGRSLLLFKDEDDALLAYIVLQSYHGPLQDLPFASAPPPGTCMAMIARSHFKAWRQLPLLALLGLTPTVMPDHDDMRILAQKAEAKPGSGSPNPTEPIALFPEPMLFPDARQQQPQQQEQQQQELQIVAETHQAKFKKSIYDWLDLYYSTGHHNSLKNMCRVVIRRTMRVPDETQIEKLRLPSTIKDYMMLRHAV